MADVFIEHMVTQKMNATVFLKKLGLFCAALVLAFMPIWLQIFGAALQSLLPITLVGAGYGFFYLNRRQNLEFEYILTNGELDVDKIMGKASRKRLLTVHCRQFDILAPLREEYAGEYRSPGIHATLDVSAGKHSPGRWFAVFPAKDGVRTLLIFEPNERMLEAMKIFTKGKMKT